MNEMKIVAISGASGCGKTSTIKKLSQKFNCPYLLFDDHTEKDTYPTEMKTWFDKGADVNAIKTPKFTKALNQLKIENAHQYVFIEEPFGRERECLTLLIDYVVLLDTPLEICLTRIIRRNINNASKDSYRFITPYLVRYEDHLRDIYQECVNQVRINNDLVIAERHSSELTSKLIGDWLEAGAKSEC